MLAAKVTVFLFSTMMFASALLGATEDPCHLNLAAIGRLIGTFVQRGIPNDQIDQFVRDHPDLIRARTSRPHQQTDERDWDRDWDVLLASMDQAMPSKTSQLITMIPMSGIAIDVGTGSGTQAYAYSLMYPELMVIGIDNSLEAIRHAQREYTTPNLLFLQADARESIVPPDSVDAVIASSFDHELMSYSGFNRGAYLEHLAAIHRMLRPGGSYGTRDFFVPKWPNLVRLHLPTAAEQGRDRIGQMSRAELFEEYARTFKSGDYPAGIPYWPIAVGNRRWAVFQVDRVAGANFIHRMEYRNSWDSELREQYPFFTMPEKVEAIESIGMRVDYAAEIHSTWIYLHSFKNRLIVTDTEGNNIDLPPTNGLIYAIKPGPDDPLRLEITPDEKKPASWMKMNFFRKRSNPEIIYDVIHVPGITEQYIPFDVDPVGNVSVYLLQGVERPAWKVYGDHTEIYDVRYSGFGHEGMGQVIEGKESGETTVERLRSVLKRKTGFKLPKDFRAIEMDGSAFLPGPGMTDEIVFPKFLELQGSGHQMLNHPRIRKLDLKQLIGSGHVGSIPDGRLEAAAYRLARDKKVKLQPWFDGELPLTEQGDVQAQVVPSIDQLRSPRSLEPEFEPSPKSAGFTMLQIFDVKRIFSERTETGTLELSLPRNYSLDTSAAIPYYLSEGIIYVGFERRALPTFEARGLSAGQVVVPAWRIKKGPKNRTQATAFLRDKMLEDFGIVQKHITPLGEGYFPAAANSPEKVTFFAVEMDGHHPPKDLVFVPLENVIPEIELFPDLHTRVALYRFCHAVDLF